jgi:uncharacterized protein (TIGR02285 family)
MKVLILFLMTIWGVWARAEMSPPERGKVMWVVPDWPSSSVDENSDTKANVFVRVLEQLQDAVPQYDHHLIRGTADKALRLWREGKNICALPLLKTKDREELVDFTAFIVVPPYRVIVKNSQVGAILAKHDVVSFQNLMTSKNIKGGLIMNRSYGETLDRLLGESPEDERNWTMIEPQEGWETVLKMVQNGRFDYTVEMAEYVRFFNKKNSKGSTLVALPIKEFNKAQVAYVACNKNKWGRDIVKLLDKKLQTMATQKDYMKNLETLFQDDGLKDFKQDLQDFVQKRSEGPWQN